MAKAPKHVKLMLKQNTLTERFLQYDQLTSGEICTES